MLSRMVRISPYAKDLVARAEMGEEAWRAYQKKLEEARRLENAPILDWAKTSGNVASAMRSLAAPRVAGPTRSAKAKDFVPLPGPSERFVPAFGMRTVESLNSLRA